MLYGYRKEDIKQMECLVLHPKELRVSVMWCNYIEILQCRMQAQV